MSNGCLHLRTLGRVDLSHPDGAQVRSVLAQPKRLALLIYLATATPPGFHRKDTLLGLFWPESPDGHARRALNRAVYFLRQSLGRDLLIGRGDEEIAVAGDLWCDVAAFERAVEAGRLEEALEVYQGDFAPGFFVSGLPELERWMDSERTRLRGRAAAAALRLAEREEMRDELSLAAHWLHRAVALAPHDEAVARRRIDLLSRAGDRTGALDAYQELAARLRDDLEVEPSSETRALEQAVRRRPDARVSALPVEDTPAPPAPTIAAAPGPPLEQRRGRLAWVAGGALIAAGAAAAVAMAHGHDAVLTLGHRTAVAIATEFERWPALSPDGGTVFYTRSGLAGDELFAQEVQGGRPLPLTATLSGSQRYGALSPDGKLLLFRQDDGLYLMPALGGEPRRVVPAKVVFHHPGFQELAGAWAPDSRHIAYAELDTLFTQTVGEAGRTAVSTGVAVHSPAWSSDGRWIAFVEGNPDFHVRGNLAFSAVRVVPAHGGETMAITDASALNTSPVWIPGRRSLLFISDRDGGRDIYQVAVARNGAPRNAAVRITTGLNPERLAISADGRRIAWSVLTETSNIRSLDVAAAVAESIPLSRARPITTGNQLVEAVGGVSPDGAWLYYHGTRSGVTDLWRTPLAGGGDPERLTFDSAMSFAPAVSPDGREIAFHALRTGNRDIFVMPAAGGPAALVSNSPDQEGVPAWSPDGHALIWLSGDTVRMAKRGGDGAWGPYRSVLRTCGCGGWVQWSPDGRWISWPGLSGLELFDPSTGRRRLLGGGAGTTWHVWSRDGRTVFAVNIAGREGVRVMSISVRDGRRRILGYADNPTGQVERYGLAEHEGRLYFPLVERGADVWVAELGGS